VDINIKKIRNVLSKIKFKIGLDPKIEKTDDYEKYIPDSYKSVLIFYADFELAWAWRYSKALINNKKEVRKIALNERENASKIIELCELYNISITWATVGHLFLEECKNENEIVHPDIYRTKHFENDYWIYSDGDWFDDDPCSNYKDSPEWYCPDLIKKIMNSKVKHEIGCHTFSHIDCRDSICSKKVFDSEISECKRLAEQFNVNLESFVHPGHTIGNLDNLFKSGFTSYRTDYGNILGYPVKSLSGLWEIKGTMELAFRKKWSVDFNIKFYKKIVDRAIKNNSVCVFWFHPSFDITFLENILPELFSYLDKRKNEILVTTAGDYVKWLNRNDGI